MATTQQPVDPYAAAQSAKAAASVKTYFGQVSLLDLWFCRIVPRNEQTGQKGYKEAFDDTSMSPDERRTAIEITVTTLERGGQGGFDLKREFLAESSEWTRIVRPSLDKLAVQLKDLHNRWVQVEMVPNGRRWTDAATGEQKQGTTFRFVAFYPDEAATRTASAQFFASRRTADEGQGASPAPTNGNGANGSAERATAARFLKSFWEKAAREHPDDTLTAFLAEIAANALTRKHFDATSPEITDLVMKMTSEVPF